MKVSREQVLNIARLSRLELKEDEIEAYRSQLDQIISYVEKLNEYDTDDVVPTYYVQQSSENQREDKVKPSMGQEEALRNAPAKGEGFFRVPKII